MPGLKFLTKSQLSSRWAINKALKYLTSKSNNSTWIPNLKFYVDSNLKPFLLLTRFNGFRWSSNFSAEQNILRICFDFCQIGFRCWSISLSFATFFLSWSVIRKIDRKQFFFFFCGENNSKQNCTSCKKMPRSLASFPKIAKLTFSLSHLSSGVSFVQFSIEQPIRNIRNYWAVQVAHSC